MSPSQSNSPSSSSPGRLRRLADEACDELERCLRQGVPCRAEDLLARFGELAGHRDFALEIISFEFALRQQLGQAPSVEEFRARFPDWSDCLGQQLRVQNLLHTRSPADYNTLAEPATPIDPAVTRNLRRPRHLMGDYELLEQIGRGGMGDVYRARQAPPLQRFVALKLLRDRDEFDLRSFEKEIEVARRLRHAHLLPIYDAGCIDGEYFYTMPLLSGGSLQNRLRQGRPDVRWAARLLEQVARAVHYAHQQGVLHRDLKSANILLDDNDEPLVADFGLAKLLDRAASQTRTGHLVGSVPYMAPEQASGHGHQATPGTDVWALGVILYEMLTGQRPFVGHDEIDILRRITSKEPARPRTLRPDLPADLEAICLKCLEKDAAWRYRSAAELADDLTRWLAGLPLPELADTLATRVRRAAHRYLGGGARGALLLVCLGLSPLLFLIPQPAATVRQTSGLDALRGEETRASPAQPLTVLAPNRSLRWSRVEVGEDAAKITHKPGEPLSVRTLSVCLLEVLPPNPRRGSYRLVVQMQHADALRAGSVGVYVGRCRHRAAGRVGHSFVKAEFAEPQLRRLAGENLTGVPPELLHSVDLGLAYLRVPNDRPPQPLSFRTDVRIPLPAGQAPDGQALRRTLTLEVTARTVRLRAENQQGEVPVRHLRDNLFPLLFRLHPDLKAVAPEFAPTGGIGIFVFGGAAIVHSIQWQPLPDAP